MRFDSAMAVSHVAGSDSAFAGKACEAPFTLPLTTPIARRPFPNDHTPLAYVNLDKWALSSPGVAIRIS